MSVRQLLVNALYKHILRGSHFWASKKPGCSPALFSVYQSTPMRFLGDHPLDVVPPVSPVVDILLMLVYEFYDGFILKALDRFPQVVLCYHSGLFFIHLIYPHLHFPLLV